MTNRTRVVAYVVTALYSLVVFLAGAKIDGIGAKAVSLLPAFVVAAFALYDNFLWRRQPFLRLANRPDLVGTWFGSLTSMRIDESGREVTHPPVPCALVVRQSFTYTSVTMLTAESTSRSITADVSKNDASDFTVYYQYSNVPKLAHRERSPIHSGAACLEAGGSRPRELDGEYWTSRRTRGTFNVDRIATSVASSFSEARDLNEGNAPK